MDLKDAATDDTATIGQGEFNRMPFFYYEDTSSWYWMNSVTYATYENGHTEFKYSAWRPTEPGFSAPLSGNQPEFDFEITASSGF